MKIMRTSYNQNGEATQIQDHGAAYMVIYPDSDNSNFSREKIFPKAIGSNAWNKAQQFAKHNSHKGSIMTNKQLREYLGHNGSECVVTISRQGVVKRYGSPDPFERSMDFWQYMGVRDDYKSEYA